MLVKEDEKGAEDGTQVKRNKRICERGRGEVGAGNSPTGEALVPLPRFKPLIDHSLWWRKGCPQYL